MVRCSVFVLLLAAVAARAADDCSSRHEFDQIVSEVAHRFYHQTFAGSTGQRVSAITATPSAAEQTPRCSARRKSAAI
jgi:hypothetical protein